MNKKIKSTKDIRKELDALFLNIVDKNDLTTRVEIFLNGITGKELIPEEEIKYMLMHRLDYYISGNCSKYYDKAKINELLPFEMFVKKYKKDKFKWSRIKYDKFYYTYCYNIVESSLALDDPEYKYNSMSKEVFLKELKKDSDLEILYQFFTNNATVECYIYYFIEDTKKRLLVSLIKNKLASLSSIFYFFDNSKDLRENREYFYKLLGGKFSRHTIQVAIKRELKNIKAGKFKYKLI